MILNLKNLHQDITYKHFKMDTLQGASQLLTPGCFMTSVDSKDAYYSVAVAQQDQVFFFFRFSWKGRLGNLILCPTDWIWHPEYL